MFKIAIVGKPNVGKSTLFNRIIKKRQSIVFDRSGVTRDCIIAHASFKNKEFILTDTAGFVPKMKESIDRTIYSLRECNLIFFVVGNSVDDEDLSFANWLRRNSSNKEILLIKNKCDYKEQDNPAYLGFSKNFEVSAEHNIGIRELLNYVVKKIPDESAQDKTEIIKENNPKKISIAILGRPNVGKSTLMNKLSQEERSATSEIAGTTRDPISAEVKYKNINFNLIDTAGLRRKSRVTDSLEIFSNSKAIKVIEKADIVLFLLDVSNLTLEKQDYTIINRILDSGKPIIIIANKSDKVDNANEIVDFIKLQINKFLLNEVKIFAISSLNDDDFSRINEECCNLFKIARQKISTGKLNRWLQKTVKNHSHPIISDKKINLKYITQITDRLIFNIFCNHPKLLDESYIQYLRNNFYKSFNISSAPVKFNFKSTINPYGI